MIIIVCLDENKGMMFNHRRQSRDKIVAERIQYICRGKKLWMNTYSYSLYGYLKNVEIRVDEDFLSKASKGDICLVESDSLQPFVKKIESIIVFWWNRTYPADMHLDLDLSKLTKIKQQEFAGNSHEKITEVVYGGETIFR